MIRGQCWITSCVRHFCVQILKVLPAKHPLLLQEACRRRWWWWWWWWWWSFRLVQNLSKAQTLKFSQYEFMICYESCRLQKYQLSISWRSSIHLPPWWCVRRNWQHIVLKSSSEMSVSAAVQGMVLDLPMHANLDLLPIEGAKVVTLPKTNIAPENRLSKKELC